MSAILSADDLNDFISPGVACIKPVETLPKQRPEEPSNPYEVTTEDKFQQQNAPPAQISLTDCLACSGCVTSAEAVLISLQSHSEVLNTLDSHPSLSPQQLLRYGVDGAGNAEHGSTPDGKFFVASVSPQVRSSLAATYGVSEKEAGYMIEHLLGGPQGLASGGRHGSAFTWVIDTNVVREACLVAGAEEVIEALSNPEPETSNTEGSLLTKPKKPILTSACPGWICYAEKTHPHILPHLSRLKSPQAMIGTLVKSVLSRRYGIPPDNIWHLAVMPCFDKKLEASRAEFTDIYWQGGGESERKGVRDTDCVITAREVLMLADARGISFPRLPRTPLPKNHRTPFPDPILDTFLFPRGRRRHRNGDAAAGPSGGYLYHLMQTYKLLHPGSEIRVDRGRNADVMDYALVLNNQTLMKTARYYGFRNIQNLVRKLKPAKASRLPGAKLGGRSRLPNGAGAASAGGQAANEYAYVEVMACPGGCTNGGGQIKVTDMAGIAGVDLDASTGDAGKLVPREQREWLGRVDEAYFSAESAGEDDDEQDVEMRDEYGVDGDDVGREKSGRREGDHGMINGIDVEYVKGVMRYWAQITNVEIEKLLFTSYRKVESDVGKDKGKAGEMERVAGLASSIGGGW